MKLDMRKLNPGGTSRGHRVGIGFRKPRPPKKYAPTRMERKVRAAIAQRKAKGGVP